MALLGVLALALAGCGGSGQAEAVAGDNPATGEPIRIGYVNQEQSAVGSFPDLRDGAEAAIEYVNGDIGGVAGRPIELVKCFTDGSPESSQQCGNEMIREGVAALLTGIDFSGPVVSEILLPEGIPYIPTFPTQGKDYTGENVFAFLGGSAAQFTGMATVLANDGVRSVAMIINDTPAGMEGADIFEAELIRAGITDITRVPESPTAVDFTAAVTLAGRNSPEAMVTLYTPPGCGQVLMAQRSLGVDAKLLFPSGCLTAELLDSAGGNVDGAWFIQELLSPLAHADAPDVRAFTGAMQKYKDVPAERASGNNAVGFAVVMDLVDALGRSGTEPTGPSITDALRAPEGGKAFMDSPYVCDGSVLPDFPTVCNASVRVITMDNGKQAEVSTDWIFPGKK